MPTFDPEIRRLADRLLIKPRAIDSRTGVFASEVIPGIPGVKPVSIKMIDAKTKVYKETLEVDACMVATGRAPNTGTNHIFTCILRLLFHENRTRHFFQLHDCSA